MKRKPGRIIAPVDVLYFLKRRTRLVRKIYAQTSGQFIETKRKITAGESPFDECPPGFNPEDGEPPFLEEYDDADDGLEFVGQACVSYLSSTLKLFLDGMRGERERMCRLPPFDNSYARSHGWFPAYKKWFSEIGIDMADSGADLEIVEQVVVTRNHAQHPDWIVPETSIRYGSKIADRFSRPFFGHEFDWERNAENYETERMFPRLIKIYPEKFERAVDEVDKLCEYVEQAIWGNRTTPETSQDVETVSDS